MPRISSRRTSPIRLAVSVSLRTESGAKDGFALIVSILLMSFLLILMTTLASMIRVQTLQSSQQIEIQKARLNAQYAASMAIGALAKYAGPDQRVTARSDIFDSDPLTATIEDVNESYWTGVWSTDPEDFGLGPDGHFEQPGKIKDGLGGLDGGAVTWLVNEANDGPLAHSRNADEDVLLRDAGGVADSRSIVLRKNEISNSNGTESYAWWIGDEGMKASLSSGLDISGSAPSPLFRRYKPEYLLDAVPADLRAAGEAFTQNPEIRGRLGSTDNFLSALAELAPVNADTIEDLRAEIEDAPHALTVLSKGVLCDVRVGGLKLDLATPLSESDSGSRYQALIARHGGNQVFGPAFANFSPEQPFPAHDADDIAADPGGPNWRQLASFYQNRSNDGKLPISRQQTGTSGVYPVVTHFQIHYHVALYETETSTSTSPEYVARIMLMPAVVLWNPHNVELESADYSLLYELEPDSDFAAQRWQPVIQYTTQDGAQKTWEPSTSDSGPFFFSQSEYDQGPLTNKGFRYLIESEFRPGEAKLFLPASPTRRAAPWSKGDILTDAEGLFFGGYIYGDFPQKIELDGPLDENEKLELGLRNLKIGDLSILNGLGDVQVTMVQGHDDTIALDGRHYTELAGFVAGVNQWNIRPDQLAWKVHPDDILPVNDAERTFTDLKQNFPGSLSSNFPVHGFYMHQRLPANWFAPEYSGGWNPNYLSLTGVNPRSALSWKSPLTQNQSIDDTDSEYNPSFYCGYERTFQIRNSVTSAWTASEAMRGLPVPVGYTNDTASLIDEHILFDVADSEAFFRSLADFRHANLTPPFPDLGEDNFYSRNSVDRFNVHNSQPAYPLGDSQAPFAVPPSQRAQSEWEGVDSKPYLRHAQYDFNYLLNDQLWDAYFLAGDNPAILPSRALTLRDSDPATVARLAQPEEAARSLLIDGAFNVNSTSLDAWTALLAGTMGETVSTQEGVDYTAPDRAPFPRFAQPGTTDADNASPDDAETWAGFRSLEQAEIRELARQIVIQVKKRGPFISLSHFLNRVINDGDFLSAREDAQLDASSGERYRGALAAAIEAAALNSNYQGGANSLSNSDLAGKLNQYQEENLIGSQYRGQPGYLAQHDLLAILGNRLLPRSDTFRILTYGQSGDAEARLEILVQRLPESIDDEKRRFKIIEFAWL